MPKRAVTTSQAPAPIAKYSQAIVSNGFVFVAGQGPVDMATGKLILSEDIREQTRVTLEHLKTVLEAAGSSLDKVVKVSVFLKDLADFKAMNEVYARYFTGDAPPVRTTVGVNLLGGRMKIEIDCIAEA
ncbi:MAG: RidA family protein [Planctomycetota bacterium]|nr:RidA family protein [Planctomycetota bacterium]